MAHRPIKIIAVWLLVALVLGSAPVVRAQANAPIPTMADLHAMYESKSYRVCLQQIYRVMNLRADLAKNYDRAGLFLLRGYCLLAQRDRNSAMIAFKTAEDMATIGDQKVEAHALRVLVTACPDFAYQPQAPGATRLDLVDAPQRKAAMLALCVDRFDAVARDAARVQEATTLGPIQAVVPRVLDLAALEKTATGTLEHTAPVGRGIADRVRELINKELGLVMARDNNIRQISSAIIYNGNGQVIGSDGSKWWDGVERRGLSTNDRNTLRQDIEYVGRIQETVNDGAQLAQIYVGNSDRWTSTIANTTQALELATRTLNSE